MNGIILARDASLQFKQGTEVIANNKLNNFQEGDLLFFGKENVVHVAVSLGGDKYIHASGIVKVNDFNPKSENFSAFRERTFMGAKRIIGTEELKGIQHINEHPWY